MPAPPPAQPHFEFHPVTPDRWPHLEKLFGKNGAYAGCWCMWWRTRRSQFDRRTGQENRAGLKALVDAGRPPGVLAYADGQPVGWVSLAPREEFANLERSRTLKRVDGRPVWSVVCFYVAKGFRGQGLMSQLLAAAVDYARERGATTVEAYPIEPGEKGLTRYDGYTGVISAFRKAGFVEVARPKPQRAIMRRILETGPAS